MPVMLSAALPVLLSVMLRLALVVPTTWLPKARLLGARPTTGAGACWPVPLRATLPVPLLAFEANCSVAVRLPVAVGRKVNSTVQLWAGCRATEVLQVPAVL